MLTIDYSTDYKDVHCYVASNDGFICSVWRYKRHDSILFVDIKINEVLSLSTVSRKALTLICDDISVDCGNTHISVRQNIMSLISASVKGGMLRHNGTAATPYELNQFDTCDGSPMFVAVRFVTERTLDIVYREQYTSLSCY